MHCPSCQIHFNTLSAFVKHHRDLHSHNKKFRLNCSCGGTFSSLRSLQTHWWRFHKERHQELEKENEEPADETELESIYDCDQSKLDHRQQDIDQDIEDLNTSIGDGTEEDNPTQNGQVEMLEKRILYLLLTLQTVFYTSETAINYVAKSLLDLFLAVSSKQLDISMLASAASQMQTAHMRKKKAEKYFDYVEPISHSYKTLTKNKELKTVKYSYVPFLASLAKYLRLPEVQIDLHRTLPRYDPICLHDVHDGELARNHPKFKNSIYLKIELNSDDLTVTNPISHRAHSIFFFYWSLLNVSKENRSKQSSKRLVAACPKWARKYNSLSHTVDDFLVGINILSTTGITINVNGNDVTYYGGLFISLGDYPAQMSLHGFKESVTATHFCHLCDIQHDNLEEDICHNFSKITQNTYRERCNDLELVVNYPQSYDNLSKIYGINSRSLFDDLYDVTRQCPFDVMHSLLEGVLPNHLNAFLEYCSTTGRFTIREFCEEVNQFPYDMTELRSKPRLDLAADQLKKQNNLGMPLTSMQTFYLFINLPFILKKMLQSSDFPQYKAILLCVDILSLCFATTISNNTHEQLHKLIYAHNEQFKLLYPGKMKFKFHFMTHFPAIMRDFGPLSYTSCLATERKHQFFKGNKVRNLKNTSLMLARRHELWVCVSDHSQDGSLSHTVLTDAPEAKLDERQSIDDDQIKFLLTKVFKLPFRPLSTLKSISLNGYHYSQHSFLNVSEEIFPTLPIFGKIRWIFYDGKRCAFGCALYYVKTYVQQLRAFQIEETNKLDYFLIEDLGHKKPLKLVFFEGSFFISLHPYGKSLTIV